MPQVTLAMADDVTLAAGHEYVLVYFSQAVLSA